MNKKIDISRLKKLITESKMEKEYYEKFVEGFEDVRELDFLTEAELNIATDELYKIIFEEGPENSS